MFSPQHSQLCCRQTDGEADTHLDLHEGDAHTEMLASKHTLCAVCVWRCVGVEGISLLLLGLISQFVVRRGRSLSPVWSHFLMKNTEPAWMTKG